MSFGVLWWLTVNHLWKLSVSNSLRWLREWSPIGSTKQLHPLIVCDSKPAGDVCSHYLATSLNFTAYLTEANVFATGKLDNLGMVERYFIAKKDFTAWPIPMYNWTRSNHPTHVCAAGVRNDFASVYLSTKKCWKMQGIYRLPLHINIQLNPIGCISLCKSREGISP